MAQDTDRAVPLFGSHVQAFGLDGGSHNVILLVGFLKLIRRVTLNQCSPVALPAARESTSHPKRTKHC